MNMNTGMIVLVASALFFGMVGVWYARKGKSTAEGYISSRNQLSSPMLFATLVATAMGAWILFSPAETSIVAGSLGILGYALGSASALFIFIWIGKRLRELLPEGHTLTEFVHSRYGKVMHGAVLLISAFYMGVFLTAELTGISLAFSYLFSIPALWTVLILGICTVAYTAIGGLRVSILTDRVQSWFILPLIGLLLIASLLFVSGGFDTGAATELLSPTFPGLEYGITLILAIIGAEIFNQTNWQRAYAAKDGKEMRKGFLLAGGAVFLLILAVGAFGFLAAGTHTADTPSIALLAFVHEVMPAWMGILVLVLATALVMSSMDSLLNGLVSLFTVDFARMLKKKHVNLLGSARTLTVGVAAVAMGIAIKGYSVLYLFLVADLVCVAAAFPVVAGLYRARISNRGAVLATALGVVGGALLFPDPTFTRGSLLWSFIVALAVPMAVCLLLQGKKRFNFRKLREVRVE